MKAVVQRVKKASVTIQDDVVGAIDHGMCIFVGVFDTDTEDDAVWLAKKIAGLRIFSDEQGKMSKDILEVSGRCLVISQFTLVASCMNGKRPDFTRSAPKERAECLYNRFLLELEKVHGKVPEKGRFQAMMSVSLINDGPVTLVLESP